MTEIYLAVSIFFAGLIKGYSGFGFAMIAVLTWSMVMPPVQAVPVIIAIDAAASAVMLPGVWEKINWRSLTWLYVGVVVSTPMGVLFLAHVPDRPMKAFISCTVLVLTGLLWNGHAFRKAPGRIRTLLTGLVSGALNGSSSIGGPPVILYYLSMPGEMAACRASMVAYFFVTDVVASIAVSVQGLVTRQTVVLFGLSFIPLVLGISLGSRFFSKSNEEGLRKKVLILLACLSVAALIKSII